VVITPERHGLYLPEFPRFGKYEKISRVVMQVLLAWHWYRGACCPHGVQVPLDRNVREVPKPEWNAGGDQFRDDLRRPGCVQSGQARTGLGWRGRAVAVPVVGGLADLAWDEGEILGVIPKRSEGGTGPLSSPKARADVRAAIPAPFSELIAMVRCVPVSRGCPSWSFCDHFL